MTDHSIASATILDHFYNPRNVGDLEEANAVGEVGSASCGDVMRLSLKIAGGKIVAARFRTYGCGTAIASSSVLTELISGRTLEDAARVSHGDISRALGGVPAVKSHCPVLAEEALKAALADFRQREKRGQARESLEPRGKEEA